MMAWEGGAKGCTTFNPGGKKMALLVSKKPEKKKREKKVNEPKELSCVRNSETGQRDCG
jgi:ribonucleoside-diphosphate reductase alpha chain